MIVFVSFSLENLGHRNKLPTRPLPRVKTRYDIGIGQWLKEERHGSESTGGLES